MLIYCFSGKRLSGVRCFVMRDLGGATSQEPIGARRTFYCQALILPRDGTGRRGCESKLLWSFRLRLRRRRVASWGSGAGCVSPWELRAQLPAARLQLRALGRVSCPHSGQHTEPANPG